MVIIFIGKLYILFNIKLFSVVIDFRKDRLAESRLLILLKNSNFSLKKYIKNKINIKYEAIRLINFRLTLNLNSSFDAIDVIYIKRISIPPKKIKNKEYENQKVLVMRPDMITITIV